MFAILGLLPTILTTLTGLGTTASSISKDIRDLQMKKEETKSNERLREIDAQIQALHDRKDVLVAEAGSRINGFVRAGFAIGPMLYVFKYYAIDKVIGSFVGCSGEIARTIPGCKVFATDGLSPQMAAVMTACIAFYFVTGWINKR